MLSYNINIHLNNNPMTTPDSLFYCRFPWPKAVKKPEINRIIK